MPKDTKSVIIREFPVALHAEFKSLCALEPVTIQRKIVELVEDWVNTQNAMIDRIRDYNRR